MESTNKTLYIKDPLDVLKYWSFFNEGRIALNDMQGAKMNCTEAEFLSRMLKIVTYNEQSGIVLLCSKNGKPLAFAAFVSVIDFEDSEYLYVWAAYTNQRCKTAMSELVEFGQKFCRDHGITKIKAATKRINGAATRLFERSWKFHREFLTFSMDI